MIIKINPINPQKRLIKKIINSLNNGGIIVYPTDTIYGIGCKITNKKAIKKIYKLKPIKKDTPLSFICSGFKNISMYAKVSNFTFKIMKRLLPGPYTFILKASKLVPKIMLTKRKTIGIRMPDNKICMTLVKSLNFPIISTSATINQKIILDPQAIKKYFSNNLDYIIDGGIIPNEPSTIISLIDDIPKIIRIGLGNVNIFKN